MSNADGVWETVTNTPMGQQKATMTLATAGDVLTGTLAGAQGTITIKDGKVDGDKLTWKADIESPMPMTLSFSATVDGDAISGNVALGAFGNASFEGKRAS